MKKSILFLLVLFAVTSCAVPKNPSLSFGKKCTETNDGQIAYSYVWIYDKDTGLQANKETCKQLEKE